MGHIGVGWDGSCRGGWVMQGCGGSCRVGWVMQWWWVM